LIPDYTSENRGKARRIAVRVSLRGNFEYYQNLFTICVTASGIPSVSHNFLTYILMVIFDQAINVLFSSKMNKLFAGRGHVTQFAQKINHTHPNIFITFKILFVT
jgi:CO dehydrogenase/acetyl-CoA synthase alpha subunit